MNCAAGRDGHTAKAAGLKGGDKIVAFNGKVIDNSAALQSDIRSNPGKDVTLTVERGGRKFDLTAHLIKNQVSKTDGNGGYVEGKYRYTGSSASRRLRHRPAVVRPVREPYGRHDAERRRVAGLAARQDP